MGLAGIVDSVKAVQGGDLVAFGQGRVIEDSVYQGVDRALESYNGLSDVNEFGRPFSNNMNTQELARFPIKQNLQQPGGVV
jgi:hypothetical protein